MTNLFILLWQWADTDVNGYSAMSTTVGLLLCIAIGIVLGFTLFGSAKKR